MAWSEAVSGNEKIALWLFENGYPELICVIDFLWGSTKAGEWFIKNRIPELRAFAEFVGDENPKARKWLVQNKFDVLVAVGDAVYSKNNAIESLNKMELPEFVILANKINKLLYQIEFDTNLIYRSPIS